MCNIWQRSSFHFPMLLKKKLGKVSSKRIKVQKISKNMPHL